MLVRREDAQRNRIYRLGLMFLGMPESTRSRIVRFVFGIEKSAVRG
jgi:c-di-GMP-binding flagellar brake protein YcgR